MTLANHIQTAMQKSSWIRKMFEEGARLKSIHGADRVFDFSLGNPNLLPPDKFRAVMRKMISGNSPLDHGYMPNTGYPAVRQKVARYLAKIQKADLTANDIVMTCGAAGALNVILKAILNPGDEVLTPAPCFVEYGFYASNHGGQLKTVATRKDFTLDMEKMAKAIGPKTKAVLINSPNNPTGQIYSHESLCELGALLTAKSRQHGHLIYLLADEPYRKIVFDNIHVPEIFPCYADSIIATSHAKDLSIAGERIGYLVVNPNAHHRAELQNGFALTNRILGFVNAPAFMQRVAAEIQDELVDVGAYQRKRDLLCEGLRDAGYHFITPPGTFYVFPQSPIEDDVQFVHELQEERILVVPGSGFMGPGHFRIAFCVQDETISSALPGFKRVMGKYR